MEVFNSYVRGGLEVMKERFLDGCSSDDDYLRRTMERFQEFKNLNDDIPLEDSIAEILNNV